VFSITESEDLIFDLIDYIKSTKDDYLNLEFFDKSYNKIIEKRKTFDILETDIKYFLDRGHWSFDDSPYYATLDYALNKIYDERYFSYPDIWSAEWYLKSKFDALDSRILRPITNKQIFRRINFIGKNDWNKESEIDFLNKKFIIEK